MTTYVDGIVNVNPLLAKFSYLNFHPPEVVFPYRNPNFQVGEDYSYLFNLRSNISKSFYLNTHLIPNNHDLITL